MFKYTLFFLAITVIKSSPCSGYKPVCGENNVTYANACLCPVPVRVARPCKQEMKPVPAPYHEWKWGSWQWGDHRNRPMVVKAKRVEGLTPRMRRNHSGRFRQGNMQWNWGWNRGWNHGSWNKKWNWSPSASQHSNRWMRRNSGHSHRGHGRMGHHFERTHWRNVDVGSVN